METKITKQIAGLLYGFSYQLQDNEGNLWDISSVTQSYSYIESEPGDNSIGLIRLSKNSSVIEKVIDFSEIGSTYKILARPKIMMNEIIEVKGERFVPANRVACFEDKSLLETQLRHMPFIWLSRLMEWHFNIDFPEGTTTNLI